MIIRELVKEDLLQHEYVSSQAFVYRFDPDAQLEMSDNMRLGAFLDDDKTLAAQIECTDYETWFCGQKLKCAGIGGVATRPEYRRMGAVRQLFERFYDMSADSDYAVSILYPFSESFYRKFGYGGAGCCVRFEIDFRELASIERSLSVELYNGEQTQRLCEMYNAYAAKYNLSFLRNSERYFNSKPWQSASWTYIHKDSSGKYNAFASFRADRDNAVIYVSEIGYLDKASLLGMLGFLRTYEGNYRTVVFEKLPLGSPIFSILGDPNNSKRTLLNLGSVRIMDLQRVLEAFEYPDEPGEFTVLSQDTIEKNAGLFRVCYSGGTAKIERAESGSYDIAADAAALSEIVLCGVSGGYESLKYKQGVEIVNENPDLIRAFPIRNTFFVDGF